MRRNFFILLVLTLLADETFSQRKTLRDSVYRIPIVGLHFAGQLPGADMAKRFGPTIAVGMPILFKTGKNILFGIEGSYFFGTQVKERVMSNLLTPEGTITDANGNPGAFRINERGWNIYGMAGAIINKFGHNKNSGFMAMAGIGYLQHKVNIYDVGRNLQQIHGNLIKGYDRLTGGPALNQFIGYMFISQSRLVNFYFGFEFQEAFTKGLRSYQYDLMSPDNQSRFDMIYGFRFGWLLPLYKKVPKEFYYY
jgi:hypothetical protein